MTIRGLLLLQAAINGLLALFTFSLPLWASGGEMIVLVLALAFAGLAGYQFWELRRTGETEMAFTTDNYAAASKLATFYQILAYCIFAFYLVLTVMTVTDLNHLESGAVLDIHLVPPLDLFYRKFGYWTTVLSIPLVSMLLIFSFYQRWQFALLALEEEQAATESEMTHE